MARFQSRRSKTQPPSGQPESPSFEWEPGVAKHIAWYASIASVAIGLVLAAYQVQGWKMPKPLAVTLIVILLVMAAVALLATFFEVGRTILRYREYRATNPAFVSTENPGLLDYEADGIRATKRLTKEYNEFAGQTGKLGKKMERHTKATESRGASWGPKKRQRRANRAAKAINKSAMHTEKRLSLLKALVADVLRNAEGLVANIDLSAVDAEDIQGAKDFRDTLTGTHQEGTEALKSVAEYRETVQNTEQMNLSRTMRIASARLGGALDGVVDLLKKHTTESRKIANALDNKIKQAEGGQI